MKRIDLDGAAEQIADLPKLASGTYWVLLTINDDDVVSHYSLHDDTNSLLAQILEQTHDGKTGLLISTNPTTPPDKEISIPVGPTYAVSYDGGIDLRTFVSLILDSVNKFDHPYKIYYTTGTYCLITTDKEQLMQLVALKGFKSLSDGIPIVGLSTNQGCTVLDITTSIANHIRNSNGLTDPQPGHLWHEMFSLQYYVIHVTPTHVVYSDTIDRSRDNQRVCDRVMKVCTRDEWIKLLCYDSPGLEYVSHCDLFKEYVRHLRR